MTATDLTAQRVSNSPAVAKDPRDDRVVAIAHRADGRGSGCGLEISGNAGESWTPLRTLAQVGGALEHCTAPDVKFGPTGRLYFLFSALSGEAERAGIYLSWSDDRGHTFTLAQRIVGDRAYGGRLATDLTHSRGLYVVWLEASDRPTSTGFGPGQNTIMLTRSDDGGATFSTPVRVDSSSERRVAAPGVAVGAGGQLVVAYFDLQEDARDYAGDRGPVWDGKWSLVVKSTARGGDSFVPALEMRSEVVPATRVPSIFDMAPPAVAAAGGRVCVAWMDGRFGDPDVFTRCSLSGRWGRERRVNDDKPGNGYWQYLPSLAVAENGRIDVAFYDRRNNLRNRLTGVAFTYSYDGRAFSRNTFVSGPPFDGTLDPSPGGDHEGEPDLGDRTAVLAGKTSALIAWGDTRTSAEPLVAEDVYAAKATLLFSSDRPPWAGPVGAALCVAGGSGVWCGKRLRRT